MLSKIKIQNLYKTAYDCFLQQLMILSQFYCDEYWKLFIDIKIEVLDRSEENVLVCKQLVLKSNYLAALKKYYGISLVEAKEGMCFSNEKEIYMVVMDSEKYPLYENSLDNHLEHFFLVYNQKEQNYVVNDNFYDRPEYLIEKSLIDKYAKKIYKVKKEHSCLDKKEVDDLILKIFKDKLYENWTIVFENLQKSSNVRVEFILELLRNLSEYIDSNSQIANGYPNPNLYMKECANILSKYTTKINALYFSVLKEFIKREQMENDFIKSRLDFLNDYILGVREVKTEIYNILTNKSSLADTIILQIEDFLEQKINTNRMLCDEGIDQYILLALLSYFEMTNNIGDIDVMLFDTNSTFQEIVLKLYQYKLLDSKQKDVYYKLERKE